MSRSPHPPTKYVPVEVARSIIDGAGLPIDLLWRWANTGRAPRRDGENRGAAHQLRVRTKPDPRRPHRLLYHLGDLRAAVAEVLRVQESGPRTMAPFVHRGVTWLSSALVAARGFDPPTVLAWLPGGRYGSCPWLGRPLASELWLAQTAKGRLRWTRFYREDEILEIERKIREHAKPIIRRAPAKPRPRRVYDTPDPQLWADTAEAMRITGASDRSHLQYWSKNGFPLPGGRRLPLKRQDFRVKRGRGALSMFFWRPDLIAISFERTKRYPLGAADLPPFEDDQGVLWQRERRVMVELECTKTTLNNMSERCPVLNGAPFIRQKVPSIYSTKPEEWAYRDDLHQKVKLVLTASREQLDAWDICEDSRRRRYLPLQLAKRVVPYRVLTHEAGEATGSPIHVLHATLPYRPNRKGCNGREQKVYNEKDLYGHPAATGVIFRLPSIPHPSMPGGGRAGPKGGSRVELKPAPNAAPAARPTRPGAPKVDPEEAERRSALLEDWERARSAGVSQKAFCAERGIPPEELRTFQMWSYQRRKRAVN